MRRHPLDATERTKFAFDATQRSVNSTNGRSLADERRRRRKIREKTGKDKEKDTGGDRERQEEGHEMKQGKTRRRTREETGKGNERDTRIDRERQEGGHDRRQGKRMHERDTRIGHKKDDGDNHSFIRDSRRCVATSTMYT